VALLYRRNYQKVRQLNREIEQRSEEISAQSEELAEMNARLQLMNDTTTGQRRQIEAQASELLEHNKTIKALNTNLESLLEEKGYELVRANEELFRYNSEMLQYSYTVSHNLRGPVARILGLISLLKRSHTQEEADSMIRYIEEAGLDLDAVLKDLSKIIDVRNDLYRVREKVYLDDEWSKVISMIGDAVKPEHRIDVDFSEAPLLYTIRPMIHSILYNLVSNAIKYRSADRPLQVKVQSQRTSSATVLRVSDNGLGIDLARYQQSLFKLYKRFHVHVEGKGLGLYLIKTKVDALRGSIDVQSELNKGTTFIIALPDHESVEKQVYFESETAQLYYDANLNCTVILWKQEVTSLSYRAVFETVLNTLKIYNSPGWIADLRNQGPVPDEDQIWFITRVLPEARKHGLRRIAAVGFKDPIRLNYYERMIGITNDLGIHLQVFEDMESAIEWMREIVVRPLRQK
jgi:signal transduction histidine kinase